jgi:hypothetical protein
MRLSEAIALGQGTVGRWEKGNLAHCALGMACNSVGIIQKVNEETQEYGNYDAIRKHWPWLTQTIEYPFRGRRDDGSPVLGEAIEAIYDTFDQEVMNGEVTFERYLDWIRSIEPQEEPEEKRESPCLAEAEPKGV